MNASAFSNRLQFVLVLGAAGLCGACSSVESMMPTMAPSTWNGATTTRNADRNAGPTTQADKVVTLPMNSADLDCPDVDVQDAGASYRVGGADNASVRYQFDIGQTARECDPQGDNFALKVGVSGHLLIGPAGSPGAFSAPLQVTVIRQADQKPAYSKVYKLEVNTAGAAEAPFAFVSDPIVLPMKRSALADDYSISVGFGAAQAVKVAPQHKRHPAKPNDAH